MVAGDDLPAALPWNAPTDRGHTGAPMRAARSARRERVTELFRRYIDSLVERDESRLRAVFDDPIVDLDGSDTQSREAALRYLSQWASQSDPSQLAAVSAIEPVVRSVAELRRAGRTPPTVMRPDDWLVETFPRPAGAFSLGGPLPRALLVRWVGDEPLVVGIAMPRQLR
jgi:hypothetical protein